MIDEKKLIDKEKLLRELGSVCAFLPCGIKSTEDELRKWIEKQPELSLENKTSDKWIPFKLRKADEEEREVYGCDAMLDCKLPDEDEEILITNKYGHVYMDIFCSDYRECYLESGNEFVTEAVAWMPLPEAYKRE